MESGKVVFALNGGGIEERAQALLAGFKVGETYTLMGGQVSGFSSYYEVLEIDGKWNTCLFEGSWEKHREFLHLDF